MQPTLHHITNELKRICEDENKTKPQLQPKPYQSQDSLTCPLPTPHRPQIQQSLTTLQLTVVLKEHH